MLTSWEIWNERNARVFRNVSTMLMVVVAKIKGEAALWSAAGVTHLGSIMPREWSFCIAILHSACTKLKLFLIQ
jgi:hypothetical protein